MQIYSYNQIDTAKLISIIKALFNDKKLSSATIRTVFTKNNSGEWNYFIGKCEFGVLNEDESIIYSEHAFITKNITNFDLKVFLNSIDNGGYEIHPDMPHIKNIKEGGRERNLMWNEENVPSHLTVSGYPARKYNARLESNAYYSESGLIGFNMPFYASSGDYLKKYLRMHQFHGASDARNGEFSIEIPDHRGRILVQNGKLSIEGTDKNVCLVGKIPSNDSILLTQGDEIKFENKDLSESELWLVTEENEILDSRLNNAWPYLLEDSDNDVRKRDKMLKIIEQGETHTCEFKTYIDITSQKAGDIEKTVCAFSNAKGGHLFLGVTDDGMVEGVDHKLAEHYKANGKEAITAYVKDIKKRLSEILRFNQCFEISPIQLGNKYLVVIEVTRSRDTNYYTNTRLAYVRRGASSFKMVSAEEREKDDRHPY
jgi:hypothetical protein